MSRTLEEVVTSVAAELMAANVTSVVRSSERVLEILVGQLGVDISFLRHNDHTIHATKLIAQWPPRPYIPDPDPIGVVHFVDADPVFAAAEHLKAPLVMRPEPANDDYQRRIEEGTAVPASSMACVPLLSGEITTGTLGFVKFGDREWTPAELNALQTIATLFAQLQARIVAEEQLHFLAERDDLTGLLNRRSLTEQLDRRLTSGREESVPVLFIDLDRLKAVNDYLGHKAGDTFIKVFADRLREAVDGPATLARIGGDEFLVMPDKAMDADDAELYARELQTRLQKRVVIDGETLTRTVSIGVAVGMAGRDSTSDVLRWADQAALSAKSAGGNNVSVLTPAQSEKQALINDVELRLEEVIDVDGALVLHYLPEIDMRTGRILATEALVRWQHPTRGLLLPDSFIGVAESINLAGRLGRRVLRMACEEFTAWRRKGLGLDIVLRVNVSPVQLVSHGFVDIVARTLGHCGLDPANLCLEITESVVVQDIEATRNTLAGLRDVGVKIAIDDFGTGYSVLTHLKSLPVDTVKIDRGFVRDLGSNPHDLAIVRAIMALADAFGLDVVAEGVETEFAAKTLMDLGCWRAQGFLFSRPVPGDAMAALLAAGAVPVHHTDVQPSPDNGRLSES
ncbi:putative bifunctional diguanylate cyclase/phosphodiesterase [Mycolicibacterium arseniciresistens]|uniref:EAL domain-containing protein n=1 Tax=Mycolicibacterium arseniciresistens TaxID=3062257 RepID=A0ABT8UET8_9MYCO|nr:EAL domain-containing protein [Mycolicibacterium arseniciresistens]MDO3635380.1 EAL domain-containing protein [Mycolicibacterium arseniciresistens]